MKTLLATLLLAGSSFAATITTFSSEAAFTLGTTSNETAFSATGSVTAAPGGFMLALNKPLNQTVTLYADTPLYAFGALFDTLPEGIGTGVKVFADNTLVGQFGVGVLFQGFFGFKSTQAFNTVRFETNNPFGDHVQEHLTVTDIRGTAVPEPEAYSMIGAALLGLVIARRKR